MVADAGNWDDGCQERWKFLCQRTETGLECSYVAYSLGDKNIGKYNEYTPGGSDGYGSYGSGSYYYGGNVYGGGWLGQGFSHESWTHDNTFDWGLSFQVGLEIGSCVMNVGYDASLGKEYQYDSVDLKYHTYSLSVGYKFKLGK